MTDPAGRPQRRHPNRPQTRRSRHQIRPSGGFANQERQGTSRAADSSVRKGRERPERRLRQSGTAGNAPNGGAARFRGHPKLAPIPEDCGDDYCKPPFLTASGDLSHYFDAFPTPYGRRRVRKAASASHRDDDLPLRVSRSEIPKGFRGLAQRVAAIDHGLELAFRDELRD